MCGGIALFHYWCFEELLPSSFSAATLSNSVLAILGVSHKTQYILHKCSNTELHFQTFYVISIPELIVFPSTDILYVCLCTVSMSYFAHVKKANVHPLGDEEFPH